MKRRILSLLLVLTLLLALPFAGSAEAAAKLKVTATMTSNDSLFFGENLELKVEDENGHPVTDGNVTFGRTGRGHVFLSGLRKLRTFRGARQGRGYCE